MRFKRNTEGFKKAVSYLKSINEYDKVKGKGFNKILDYAEEMYELYSGMQDEYEFYRSMCDFDDNLDVW